jgi:hypothetical protein
MAGTKNDLATRKSHGHIFWVRALGFILSKEETPNLYKIEFVLESDRLIDKRLAEKNVVIQLI